MTTEIKNDDTSNEDVAGVDTSAEPSALEMSDEDFLKMAAPAPAPKAEAPAPAPAADAPVAAPVAAPAPAAKADEGDEDEGTAEAVAPATGSQAPELKDEKVKPAAEAKKPAAEAPKVEEPVAEAPAINFEAEYKRLLGGFKANGREIKVDTVDDAIALMQMGANYNKKMAALKPNLKLMKMLEANGFLNEDKIGYLIDLGKKNPGAINKLVKESGIDPMDLSAEKGEAYKQTAYAVDDREIELDTVLDELQGSPAYTRTLDVVSNKWDVASKQVVSQSPQLLKVIADHVASGIYDLISTEVERGRMLGRLNGLSDIEAYRQVGDAIQARGGFNHLGKSQPAAAPATPVVVAPKPKPVEDDKLKDKRRAASSTQQAAPSAAAKDFNPLEMSDDEFSKLAVPKFR